MYGYMPMYYFDPTYVLIIIGVLLSMGASAKLNATYGRYSSVASRCGMTGAQAAQRILQSQGIYDVTVRHVSGRLTDHYDPRSKTVNLSDTVYGSTSIAAIGVAFHSLNPSPLEDAAPPSERKRKEATDAYSVYEEIIKDNIEYDYLIQDRYLDRDRIEEILALILETVCTKRRTIRIAGDDHPAELVKAKFMKLNSEHIRFVLDCMQENTTKIRNIKQYMKAALFNAPSTIGSYYTSLVSHDMYGGHTIQSARSRGIPDYTCNEGESL